MSLEFMANGRRYALIGDGGQTPGKGQPIKPESALMTLRMARIESPISEVRLANLNGAELPVGIHSAQRARAYIREGLRSGQIALFDTTPVKPPAAPVLAPVAAAPIDNVLVKPVAKPASKAPAPAIIELTKTIVKTAPEPIIESAQLDVLSQASDSGTPFCEECEKARLAASASSSAEQ